MTKKYAILLFVLCLFQGVDAQRNQLAKADRFFEVHAYMEAREQYLEAFEKGYQSADLYKKLGDTYYYNAEYAEALQWYVCLINEYPDTIDATYYYRAAQCNRNVGNEAEAQKLISQLQAAHPDNLVAKQFQDNATLPSNGEKFTLFKLDINSPRADFAPSFFGSDKIVFTSSANKNDIHNWNGQPFFNLFEANVHADGTLYNRRELSDDIKSELNESSAVFTKDGQTLYFTRNNPLKGRAAKRNVMRHKIYKATKQDSLWTNVVELPFNNDNFSVAHPALSPDEKRLYFASDMPGTTGASDLWFVDVLEDNQYGEPVNLGTSINTEVRETFPFVSEENILYFASDGRFGFGGLDIYFVALGDDGYPQGPVQTFGTPVNSRDDDFGFIIDTERDLIYLSSNRDTPSGDNIYHLQRICKANAEGYVTDADTKQPLPGAQLVLFDKDQNEIGRMVADANAYYRFDIACEARYTLRGSNENYHPAEETFATTDLSETVDTSLVLTPMPPPDPCGNDLGCRLKLKPIYFDLDKHNIRPDAALELAKVLNAMVEYPEMKIHIESHTDSRGSDTYNLALSDRRAKSTRLWLIDQGIDANRLTAKGYGETQLLNHCSNGVPCSVEEHQLNRRSMFIIVEE